MTTLALLAGALLAPAPAAPAPPLPAAGRVAPRAEDAPPEFGAVDWGRDVDRAFARAAELRRPVLLLFQEVPG